MSRRAIQLYTCDHDGCTTQSIGRDPEWWNGKTEQFCPEHPPVCRMCQRPLRQSNRSAKDYPGTVKRERNMTCTGCAHRDLDNIAPRDLEYVRRLVRNRVDNPDPILEMLGIGDTP